MNTIEKFKLNPYPMVLEIELCSSNGWEKALPDLAWKQRNTDNHLVYLLSLLWKLRQVKKIQICGIISMEQWRTLVQIIRLLPIEILDCRHAKIDDRFAVENREREYLPRFGINPDLGSEDIENRLPQMPADWELEMIPPEMFDKVNAQKIDCPYEIYQARYNRNTLVALALPLGISVLPTNYCLYLPLQKFELPKGLQKLSCRAIYETPIETLVIPGSCKRIGKEACYRNPKLKKLVLKEGIEIIEDSAFRFCPELVQIKWPSTLRYIADYAFFNNPHFNRTMIPKGISLDYSVFGMPAL